MLNMLNTQEFTPEKFISFLPMVMELPEGVNYKEGDRTSGNPYSASGRAGGDLQGVFQHLRFADQHYQQSANIIGERQHKEVCAFV